jgi:hypothetical protein
MRHRVGGTSEILTPCSYVVGLRLLHDDSIFRALLIEFN